MSSHKKERRLLERGAINEEAIFAYLNNQLSEEEVQQFEKLLKEDSFAQEALEGLRAAENKTAISQKISSINTKVRERTGLKERKTISIHWANYAWAAVLLGLVVGIGAVLIWFVGNQNKDIAQNNEAVQQTEETNLFEKEETPVVSIADSASVKQEIVESDTLITVETPAKETETKAEKKAETKEPQTTTTVVTSVAKPTVDVATSTAEKQKTAPVTEAKANDTNKKEDVTMEAAMKNFNSGNYKDAGEQFDALLQQHPADANALYYGGMSDYFNGNSAESEKKFDKLLKDGTKFVEGSKWYKANILLQKGKRDEAKKLLDELSESNGSYKERAIKKKADAGL